MILPERDIEMLLRRETRMHGGVAFKWVSPGNNGVPDRVVCLPGGEVWFVEVKRHKGRPRPDQVAQIRRLEALGQNVKVAAGLSGLEALFEKFGWGDSAMRMRERRFKGEL